MRHAAITLLLLAAAAARGASARRIAAEPCAAACASDLDCSLNGVCDVASGACACDAAWTGACCTRLALLPVEPDAAGYRHAATSTWGGNILADPAGGGYHMWIAEMAPNGTGGDPGAGSCGLTTWGSNSQVTHVTSATGPTGPYVRQEVAVPIWSHNPLVRLINGTFVMFHIGGGKGGEPGDGYCAANGTSPCGEQGFDQCGSTDACAEAPVPGYVCMSSYCAGDAGAAAVGVRGDCGADLAEPTLACSSYATCAPLAAAACAGTPGCVSFGLSAAWGFGKAKLFSAGTGGLTPNAQWSTWVQAGHGHSTDMYARARLEGRAPPATAAATSGGSTAGCTLDLHVSASVHGPWVPVRNVSITPCGGNNPAPWVHPNGTVYVTFTDNDIGMWRSDNSWRGPFTLVTSGACGGGEDPSLYLDKLGRFHCLFHASPFSNPDIAIGHAFSLDGYEWRVAAEPAANSTIEFAGGLGAVVHGKRERPHLYMDAAGDIAAFVTGVCITPQCDPFDGGRVDPAADCSSAMQYHHCDANSPDGWYDRTYTLVQAVATPGQPFNSQTGIGWGPYKHEKY
jgi:hypothetical protein